MKKLIFILVFSGFLMAEYSEISIANALKAISKEQGIDPRILYTLAKIESNFNPFVISFVSNKKEELQFDNAKIITKRYKNKYIININAPLYDLKQALNVLLARGYVVDVGLMQINSQNFSKDEIESIFSPTYNIKKATNILNQCMGRFRFVSDVIECYNKGFKKQESYTYFKRFKNSFLDDFGGGNI